MKGIELLPLNQVPLCVVFNDIVLQIRRGNGEFGDNFPYFNLKRHML